MPTVRGSYEPSSAMVEFASLSPTVSVSLEVNNMGTSSRVTVGSMFWLWLLLVPCLLFCCLFCLLSFLLRKRRRWKKRQQYAVQEDDASASFSTQDELETATMEVLDTSLDMYDEE
jgi:uncharacterized membrane protein